ncbi:protein FAM83A [Brienomyrus brachyistius]|uniref:protein FAM83A n=1 Tax=Brienomyrus brachyistius TaxID=42636 RepID=UPI0020B3FE5B|nr:protein FAM83A [Brienomyrus brachyistius]
MGGSAGSRAVLSHALPDSVPEHQSVPSADRTVARPSCLPDMEPQSGRFSRCHRVGKVRRRVQQIRYRSFLVSEIDLSHNESARLATDALLDRSLAAYRDVLAQEVEVDFLSREEKDYILKNTNGPRGDEEWDPEQTDASSRSSEMYCPDVVDAKPSDFDRRFPVTQGSFQLQEPPTVEVLLGSNRTSSIRDLLRESINKATTVLAVVVDAFSDVEIFCDILEATGKRGVFTYLLLDRENIHLFVEMCQKLQIAAPQLKRMSIRSVGGGTYRAKSGKKFSGLVKEKFVIIDRTQVLAGSFSFTWLSWKIHRGVNILVKGSSVEPFDLEFRQLYASSEPIPGIPGQPDPTHRPLPPIQAMTTPFTHTQEPGAQPSFWAPFASPPAPISWRPIIHRPLFCSNHATSDLSWRTIHHGPVLPVTRPNRLVLGLYHSSYVAPPSRGGICSVTGEKTGTNSTETVYLCMASQPHSTGQYAANC